MHRRLLNLTHALVPRSFLTVLSGFLAGLLTIGQAYLLSSTVNGVFLKDKLLQKLLIG